MVVGLAFVGIGVIGVAVASLVKGIGAATG
jgi:hypothetical protein